MVTCVANSYSKLQPVIGVQIRMQYDTCYIWLQRIPESESELVVAETDSILDLLAHGAL